MKAIKKDDMEYVKVEEDQVNTFLMTFQELNDISIKNRVRLISELRIRLYARLTPDLSGIMYYVLHFLLSGIDRRRTFW